MSGDTLDPALAAELLQRQAALQAEAHEVMDDLALLETLAAVGRPIALGSLALGLMAWRDIDLNILCDPLDADRVFAGLRPFASHANIERLTFRSERGRFNRSGLPEREGFYSGLRYSAPEQPGWKLDLWFVLDGAPRPDLAHLTTIPPRLTPERRLAILWLKDLWHRRPAYRDTVVSVDIYDAVLEHGVRTPTEFAAYLRARGKPADEE
jgi:hypothetical protein